MKVILYMAMTANGYIARENGDTPWSTEEWRSFAEVVARTKNMIIGRKTYEIMKFENEFAKIGNPFVVVISSDRREEDDAKFEQNPINALSLMQANSYEEVLVAGGGQLNSVFMKEGLVSEIYLDIEPLMFGRGVKLFADNDFEEKLELLDVKKLSQHTVQLHYKIID